MARGEVAEVLRQHEAAMQKLIQEAYKAGDWKSYLYRLPRAQRLDGFIGIHHKLTDAEYWRLLSLVWTDTEFPTRHRRHWLPLFTADRSERNQLMTAEEHAAFASLPDPVTLYRGAGHRYARGMSWTTEFNRAAFFAGRFDSFGPRAVFVTVLPKRKILAYFCERKEAEAVIDPRRIKYEALNPELLNPGWMVASALRGKIKRIVDGLAMIRKES